MSKTVANQEFNTKTTKANEAVFFPFVEGEIVQGVVFSENTGYKIETVEGFEEISSEENDEVKTVDVGLLKTFCLVVTTTKSVEVKLLTIKENK